MLKFPKVMKFPDGYVNTGLLGFPFPRVFWKCHRFFNAATGHIPFIWLKGKMSMNSRSGYLILASLICSRKLSVSFLYWTVRVQVGSAHDSVGESSSPSALFRRRQSSLPSILFGLFPPPSPTVPADGPCNAARAPSRHDPAVILLSQWGHHLQVLGSSHYCLHHIVLHPVVGKAF